MWSKLLEWLDSDATTMEVFVVQSVVALAWIAVAVIMICAALVVGLFTLAAIAI